LLSYKFFPKNPQSLCIGHDPGLLLDERRTVRTCHEKNRLSFNGQQLIEWRESSHGSRDFSYRHTKRHHYG
jgi:hypothetical protein